METRYEPVGRERFTVETTASGERVRIRPSRPILVMLFLAVWLAIWTVGGGAAMLKLETGFQLFLAVWLCFWAAGWLGAAATLLWMIAGSETIGMDGADVEIAQHALGFTRRRLYRGSEISNLRTAPPLDEWSGFHRRMPFLGTKKNGTIRFDYGARTIHAAPGLDEAEARLIVGRLAKRLPRAALGRSAAETV
ncbi:hypothetical protein [Aureimonas leprariae]|uniref:Uncharacterized protein n=1 Tax=Plantimonas leprariae TaxID=2615207 RepID=A0A7V7PNN3_9HYPH|nr:hypothetical protein [Aureimonas leprariae]KAB0679348.1 hypothetical protein F6X38_13515 [Aureimonas leprariae]